MEAFMKYFQKNVVPIMVRLGNQRHLNAVRNGLVVAIPFIIVGSLFLIIGNLPIKGWSDLLGGFAAKLGAPVTVTFGVLALIVSAGIGFNLAKAYDLDGISGAMLAVVGFFITQLTPDYKLNVDNFGSPGLFTAIVTALIAVEIFRFFVKRGMVIRLPEGVPQAVANSFVSLVPAGAVIVLLWIIRVVLGFDITHFLTVLFSPVVFALNTLPGILVYEFMICLLWTVGIHGDTVLGSIGEPIFLQFLAANTAAFIAHQPAPYITATGFHPMFVTVGGTGATLALVLLMLRSKDKAYSSLGKLAFPSAIFQINEPVIFGFPIVLNPYMMIPFIFTPLLLTAGTYLLMAWNIIGRPVAMVPWTMIPVIGPFLATGGDWRAAVWSVISIMIALIVYYPFFKSAEKRQAANELEVSAGQTETI
jgi:PTS system cellobiose-specific IIC component